ncbi:hypothetical protein [Deinococcus ruber]|uniref:hypothetical protein n=1 Tax=Deinococcus ruber TaxID=1848197 RepID=UPI00166C85BA|nr:hypothetical protein [Deinococcus ruber]
MKWLAAAVRQQKVKRLTEDPEVCITPELIEELKFTPAEFKALVEANTRRVRAGAGPEKKNTKS